MSDRVRADQRVLDLGLAPTRSKAQALILAGEVLDADGHRVQKSGQQVSAQALLTLRGEPMRYVSRGGYKLEAALEAFAIDPRGKTALDVGASTGGFTDCLLQRGAERVYALDVGYNQLVWELRNDPRVVVIERTNIRNATDAHIPESVDLIVFDVSFISLQLVVPPAMTFAKRSLELVALVKPQFEVGKERVGKGGIVRDDDARAEVVASIERFFLSQGLTVRGTIESPITGAKGNQEYLISAMR
ncbi:MAG: TlyA family RNA methyltransferase [Myxococcota bacterium]